MELKKILVHVGIIFCSFCLIFTHPWSRVNAQDYFFTWVEESHNEYGHLTSITRYFDWHLVTPKNNRGRRKTESYEILVPQGYNYSHYWLRVEPESARGRLKATEIEKKGKIKGIKCEASLTSQGFWGSEGYLRGYCRLSLQSLLIPRGDSRPPEG